MAIIQGDVTMMGLVADIGATNARFGLVRPDNDEVHNIEVLRCADFPDFADAAEAYLQKIHPDETPTVGALAIAAPIDGGDMVRMMNHTWEFSIEKTRDRLNFTRMNVINDFTAIAHAVPFLPPERVEKIGNGEPVKGAPIGIIGPGTGLGVSGIVFHGDTPIALNTEGGHVTAPATTDREYAIICWLKDNKYHHVSAERLVSGKGLVNVYNAIVGLDGLDLPERDAPEIAEAALSGGCKACREALDISCSMLGVVAGNLALTLGAHGGIYIAGGIVPKLGDYFAKDTKFRENFVAKGRYEGYLDKIPTYSIRDPYLGMRGLQHLLF